jgi:hypothetical protein
LFSVKLNYNDVLKQQSINLHSEDHMGRNVDCYRINKIKWIGLEHFS